MPSSSSVKYSFEISLLIFERLYLHYYAIIIIKTAILSLIAIISGTIFCPAKFVIVTGLGVSCFTQKRLLFDNHQQRSIHDTAYFKANFTLCAFLQFIC